MSMASNDDLPWGELEQRYGLRPEMDDEKVDRLLHTAFLEPVGTHDVRFWDELEALSGITLTTNGGEFTVGWDEIELGFGPSPAYALADLLRSLAGKDPLPSRLAS